MRSDSQHLLVQQLSIFLSLGGTEIVENDPQKQLFTVWHSFENLLRELSIAQFLHQSGDHYFEVRFMVHNVLS